MVRAASLSFSAASVRVLPPRALLLDLVVQVEDLGLGALGREIAA